MTSIDPTPAPDNVSQVGVHYRLENPYPSYAYSWRVTDFRGNVIISGQNWKTAKQFFDSMEDSYIRNKGKQVGRVSFIPEQEYEKEDRREYAKKHKNKNSSRQAL